MSKSFYHHNAKSLADQYNSLDAADVHKSWLRHLPEQPAMACDIGAGSGRDANWLASQGWDVVAVEPESAFRELALANSHRNVTWLDDKLPELRKLRIASYRFNLILLSAVWMHVPQKQRARAFRILTELLAPGGVLVITLRHGSDEEENRTRGFLPVNREELDQFAKQKALATLDVVKQGDRFGRDVQWETFVYRLPDDGTGSLPLLRHIIVNDDKSATYKLGLLRALIRIAEGAPGMVIHRDDSGVEVPFGLVGLYWLKTYMPLVLKHNIIQTPRASHENKRGYGWAKEHFWNLNKISVHDLRIGTHFYDEDADNIIGAINRACKNIEEMPANFITFPGSNNSIFQCEHTTKRRSKHLFLDRETLSQFGRFRIPTAIWQCMGQFACWLDPAIVNEWINVMDRWNHLYNKQTYHQALAWSEAMRHTSLARQCADKLRTKLQAEGDWLNCVWSNSRLKNQYDIDHCFPWSRWFNNDLWNLMPASSRINNQKREKLPSAVLMNEARKRILTWWESGYCEGDLRQRFFTEAQSALPLMDRDSEDLGAMFEAMLHQRLSLKRNQQLVEWTLN